MLTPRETQLILERFFVDCYKFWLSRQSDERTAFSNALEDIKQLRSDPFVPCGEELDQKTKAKFIHYRKIDLGGN